MIFSFDLDGTLCTNDDRSDKLALFANELGPICTWPQDKIVECMASVSEDEPTHIFALFLSVLSSPSRVIILTGRPPSCYEHTVEWIRKNIGTRRMPRIIMRQHMCDCKIDATVWKMSQLEQIARTDEVIHFDDDPHLKTTERVTIVYVEASTFVK